MHCFDCLTSLQRTTDAVAVCSSCGAATCGPHTMAGAARKEVHSVGSPTWQVLPGRRLWCRVCAPADAHTTVERAHTSTAAV